jgi:predicted HicB family RNase H-like nuclease
MTKSRKPGETWQGHVSQEVKTRYEAKKYDKLLIRIQKDGSDSFTADQVRASAKAEGISVNAWIIDAIRDKL